MRIRTELNDDRYIHEQELLDDDQILSKLVTLYITTKG
jgi:hypothetical protein